MGIFNKTMELINETKKEEEEKETSKESKNKFSSIDEAIKYAKENNINIDSKQAEMAKEIEKKFNSENNFQLATDPLKEINRLTEEEHTNYIDDYRELLNYQNYLKGNEVYGLMKRKSTYTKKEYSDQELLNMTPEKYLEDLNEAGIGIPSLKNDIKKALYNIGEYSTTALLGIGEGIGAGGIAKGVQNFTEKLANTQAEYEVLNKEKELNIANEKNEEERKKELRNEFENDSPVDKNNVLDDIYEKSGNHQGLRMISNIIGSIGGGMTLQSIGVPAPVAFGGMAGLRTYGQTDDVLDIGINTAIGAGFGALSSKIGTATKGALSNIPFMRSIISSNSAISSGAQMVGNIAKNAISGAIGVYGAGAITGEIENLYNLIRNRDVTKDDWLKPIWSEDALISAIIGGATGAIFGTKSDIENAKKQATVDFKNLGNNLSQYNSEMKFALKAGDITKAQTLYEQGVELINEFTQTKYVGLKLNDGAQDILTNLWNNASSVTANAFYNPTLLTSGNVNTPSNDINLQPTNTNLNNIRSEKNSNNSINTQEDTSFKNDIQDLNSNNKEISNKSQNPVNNSTEEATTTIPNNSNRYSLYDLDDKKIEAIQEQYNDLQENKANPTQIKRMIASELGIEDYNSLQSKNPLVETIYNELRNGNNILNKNDNFNITSETINNNLENTSDLIYNQAKGGVSDERRRNKEETRGDGRGRIGIFDRMGLYSLVSREGERSNRAEQKIMTLPVIPDTQLTSEQKKTRDIGKRYYNKNIVFYDGKNSNIKGLTIRNGNIYLDYDTSQKYGSEFTFKHEIAEDMLITHTKIVIDEFSDLINEIASSNNFTKLYQNYTEGMTSIDKQRLALNLEKVAKEILCDINAGKNGTSTKLAKYITDTIKNDLGIDLYNKAVNTLNKYEKQIYQKNSEKGSFFDNNTAETAEDYRQQLSLNQNVITNVSKSLKKYNGGTKPIVVGKKVWENFKKRGYIDLTNTNVATIQDMAEVAQIFRNPYYETFRIVYTQGEERRIVGHEAITSFLFNSVHIANRQNTFEKFAYKMKDRMRRLNADGYYLLHNHPSGNATVSEEDMVMTSKIGSNVDGFIGHIVIDHGSYAQITLNNYNVPIAEEDIKLKNNTKTYAEKFEGNIDDIKLNGREKVAEFALNLRHNINYSSLILVNNHFKLNAIIDIPNGMLSNSQTEGYIRNMAKKYGAIHAFILTEDRDAFENAKANIKNITDLILYNHTIGVKDFGERGRNVFPEDDGKIYRVREKADDDNYSKSSNENEKRLIKENRKLKKENNELFRKKMYNKNTTLSDLKKNKKAEQERIDQASKNEKELSNQIRTIIRNKIKIIKRKKFYDKYSNELKAEIDKWRDSVYLEANSKTQMKATKEFLKSEAIKKLLEDPNIVISDRLRNRIKDPERVPLSNYDVEELKNFNDDLDELINRAIDATSFRYSNADLNETRLALFDETDKMLKEKRRLKNTVVNSVGTVLSTFDTEVARLVGGNPNSKFYILSDNMQEAISRKTECYTTLTEVFDNFVKKNKLSYKIIDELEDSLGLKAEWNDVGVKGIEMTRGMMMSLAMSRMNTDNMRHITGVVADIKVDENGETKITEVRRGGGVVIPDKKLFKSGKLEEAYKQGTKVSLTVEEVNHIVSQLTPTENKFLEAVKEFFELTKFYTNKTSVLLTGREIANVENYFPIKVDYTSINRKPKIDSSTDLREYTNDKMGKELDVNYGFLNERTKTATNPILLEDIMSVVTRMANNVSTYYGYAPAIYDNELILNSKTSDRNLKREIDNILPKFNNYYRKMLSSTLSGDEDYVFKKLFSYRAKATLSLNLFVGIKQTLSFPTTLKFYEHALKVTGKYLSSPIKKRGIVKMMSDYLRENGVDVDNMGKSDITRLFIRQATYDIEYRNLGFRTPEVSDFFNQKNLIERSRVGKMLSVFDNMTVMTVSQLMAYDVSLDYEVGSEKYFKELKRRLEDMLRKSQPNYEQPNRTELQRISNAIARSLSQFMTPTLQMLNSAYKSLLEYKWAQKNGNEEEKKKYYSKLRKALGGIGISVLFMTIINRFKNSLLDKNNDNSFLEDLLLNAMSITLIGDEILGLFLGNDFYEISTADLDVFNTVIKLSGSIKTLLENINKAMSGDIEAESKLPKAFKDIGIESLQLFGIPSRDFYNYYYLISKILGFKEVLSLRQTPNAYKKWLENQDLDMAEFYKVYEATREKKLISDYGYVKGSDKSSEQRKQAMKRAIKSVTNKNVNKYMEIFGGYKS